MFPPLAKPWILLGCERRI